MSNGTARDERDLGLRDEPATPSGAQPANDCQYDADGQLAAGCEGAPWLAFDGYNVSGVQLQGMKGWTFFHGPGLDAPLMGYHRPTTGSSRLLYWVTDGAGRELAVADSAGLLQAGDQSQDTGTWRYAGGNANSYTFASARQDNAVLTNLSFFRNRVYDQQTGRWLQEDPIGVAGGVNLYQFNGNNPVSYTDPFGLCTPPGSCTAQGTAIGMGVGTTVGAIVALGCSVSTGGACALGAGVIINAGATLGATIGAAIGWLSEDASSADGLTPEVVRGKSPEEIEQAVPEDWSREPTRTGEGTRYKHPTNKGDQIRVMPGKPTDPNPVKKGPYCRISCDGKVSEPIPLKGNPTL